MKDFQNESWTDGVFTSSTEVLCCVSSWMFSSFSCDSCMLRSCSCPVSCCTFSPPSVSTLAAMPHNILRQQQPYLHLFSDSIHIYLPLRPPLLFSTPSPPPPLSIISLPLHLLSTPSPSPPRLPISPSPPLPPCLPLHPPSPLPQLVLHECIVIIISNINRKNHYATLMSQFQKQTFDKNDL